MAGFTALKESLQALGLSPEAQTQFFNVVAGEHRTAMPNPACRATHAELPCYVTQASCTWVRSASTR